VRRAGCGICIEPENETELADAVERMADDRELAVNLGRRGHDFFVQHFDRSKLAKTYLDLVHRFGYGRAAASSEQGDAARPTTTVGTSRREPAGAPEAIASLRAEGDLTPPSVIGASQ
jgi:hypothetical protein